MAPRARVAGHHVGYRLSAHGGIRDAALLRAIPDGRVAGAALVIGGEPRADLRQFPDALDGMDPTCDVDVVDAVFASFPRHLIDVFAEFHHTSLVRIQKLRLVELAAPLAIDAVALVGGTGVRPAIGEEA